MKLMQNSFFNHNISLSIQLASLKQASVIVNKEETKGVKRKCESGLVLKV